jgi:hypothetical protein
MLVKTFIKPVSAVFVVPIPVHGLNVAVVVGGSV